MVKLSGSNITGLKKWLGLVELPQEPMRFVFTRELLLMCADQCFHFWVN